MVKYTSFEASYNPEWGFTATLYFETKEDFMDFMEFINDFKEVHNA